MLSHRSFFLGLFAFVGCVFCVSSSSSSSSSSSFIPQVSISIDFGSEWLKVVNVNRQPNSIGSHVDMVVNEQSNRKTPNYVGFDNDDERLIGENAFQAFYKYPARIVAHIKRLIGINYEEQKENQAPQLQQYLSDFSSSGYNVVRGAYHDVGFSYPASNNNAAYTASVSELVAMIFQSCARMSEAHTRFQQKTGTVIEQVTEATVIVPEYFTAEQRAILKQIAGAAGMNIRQIVNDLSAVAVDYGVRLLANSSNTEPTYSVFYGVGAGGVSAALAEFSRVSADSPLSVRIIHSASDGSVGGFEFDERIRNHLAEKFDAVNLKKVGKSIRTSARAMAKLLREARDLKEQLSAGPFASILVEEIFEGRDFQYNLKLEDFSTITADLIPKVIAPLKSVLKHVADNGIKLEQIELFGGGVRVPAIQTSIKNDYPNIVLSKHLDGDEAAAFGGAVLLANELGIKTLTRVALTDENNAHTQASESAGLSPELHSALVSRLAELDAQAEAKRQLDAARNALESSVNEANELIYAENAKDNEQKTQLSEALSAAASFLDSVTRESTAQAFATHTQQIKAASAAYRATLKVKAAPTESDSSDDSKSKPRRASARDKAYAKEQLKKEQQRNAAKNAKEKKAKEDL